MVAGGAVHTIRTHKTNAVSPMSFLPKCRQCGLQHPPDIIPDQASMLRRPSLMPSLTPTQQQVIFALCSVDAFHDAFVVSLLFSPFVAAGSLDQIDVQKAAGRCL
jgi:hypothetical protein